MFGFLMQRRSKVKSPVYYNSNCICNTSPSCQHSSPFRGQWLLTSQMGIVFFPVINKAKARKPSFLRTGCKAVKAACRMQGQNFPE